MDVVSLLSETMLGLAVGEATDTVFWVETENRRCGASKKENRRLTFASSFSSFGFCSSACLGSDDGEGCKGGSGSGSVAFLVNPNRAKRLVLRVRAFEREEETLIASESGCSMLVLEDAAMSV